MVMMGGGGGAFMGPTATQSSATAGLPFAGVPTEMQEGADKILVKEPEHAAPNIIFSPNSMKQQKYGLWLLIRPRWVAAFVGLFLLILETGTALLGPVLTQQGIDNGVIAKDKNFLNTVVYLFLAVIGLNILISFLRQRWNGRLGEDLLYDLRIKLFSHFQRLGIDWYTSEKSGVLLSRMTSDVEALTLLINEGFVNLVIQGVTVGVVTVILFVYSPSLALLLLGLVLPPLIVLTIWFRSVSQKGYAAVRDRIADLLADLSENLSGIRVISALNRRRRNNQAHQQITNNYLDANLFTARAGAIYGPATEAVGIASQAVVLLVGGWMVLDGELKIGELTAFVLFVTTFFAPIQQMVQLYNTYQQGQSALQKISSVLTTQPTVQQKVGATQMPPIEGRIAFEDVSFSYSSGNEVLKNVNLVIEPGETFALVGATGAGKSTVAKLITRFYDPSSGRVTIDGMDLQDLEIYSLRSQLGVVPQEPFLFHGTIKENIIFAAPHATDEEVTQAAAQVGLDKITEQLPAGLDTLIHERGVSLSAGERQLIALARAFITRPRVIVLDEATSSLDLKSESHIETGLDGLLEGRTAILIAHRLATAMKADRIAVIHEGHVVELGTHLQLIELDGRYADMYRTWSSHTGNDFDTAD